MKIPALILACTVSLFASPARADVRISFDFFHESLSPYGSWCETDNYGYVWQPSGVDADWSPYTDGYWSYTDAGWTWVSYEDWGGITYHYGRWVQIDDAGWCWVPGYEWGPAWVSWRKSDDYVGWAPLPPEARWEVRTGISTWSDTHYNVGPGWYSFCHSRDFGAPVIRHVIVPRTRNVTIINFTTNITNITYNHDRGYIFNGGLDYDYIAPRCSHSVPALKLVQNTTNIFVNGNRGNVFINSQKGNTLYVAAPQRAESNWNVPTSRPTPSRVFKAPSISRGWAGLDKDGVRDRLLVKMRDDVKGATPETQPARAFKEASIAVVPKKADPTARPSLLKAPANRDDDGRPTVLKKPISRPDDSNSVAKDNERPPARPENIKAPSDRDGDGKPDTLKKPTVRPESPDSVARDNERPAQIPGGLRRPAMRPDEPAPAIAKRPDARPDTNADRSPERPSTLKKPRELEPQRPSVVERPSEPKDDSILRKKAAEQAERQRDAEEARSREIAKERERAAEESRRMTVEKQRRSAEAEAAQRKQAEARRDADESARRAAAAEKQRNAEADSMRRKQADAQRESENARRAQAAAVEKQRRDADAANARRAQEENQRRAAAAADSQRRAQQAEMAKRSADEARQRQAQAQAEAMRRQQQQQAPQRPSSQPGSSSGRQLTPEEQALLKKKRESR